MPLLRKIFGMVAGVIIAMMIMPVFVFIGMQLGATGALVLALAGWFFGTLAAAVIATRFGRSPVSGIVASLFLLGLAIGRMPAAQPMWFRIAAVLVFAVAGYLGTTVAQVANAGAQSPATPPADQ